MPITLSRRSSAPFGTPPPEKYKGPPPRAMAKSKSASNVPARMATVNAGTAALPIVNALLSKLPGAIPWLWDTAAGRHLIGKQALTPKMKEFLQQSPNPVAFRTGGVARLVKSQSLLMAAKSWKGKRFMS